MGCSCAAAHVSAFPDPAGAAPRHGCGTAACPVQNAASPKAPLRGLQQHRPKHACTRYAKPWHAAGLSLIHIFRIVNPSALFCASGASAGSPFSGVPPAAHRPGACPTLPAFSVRRAPPDAKRAGSGLSQTRSLQQGRRAAFSRPGESRIPCLVESARTPRRAAAGSAVSRRQLKDPSCFPAKTW